MAIEDDWEAIRGDRLDAQRERFSLVRPTLIFGAAGVTLAVLTALAAQDVAGGLIAASQRPALDPIATGTVQQPPVERRYTIRRSVLQSSPDAVCIIAEDGGRRGDC